MKETESKTVEEPVQSRTELGRRLREIKAKIVASGVRLFETDEEVLREVKERRAGNIQNEQ